MTKTVKLGYYFVALIDVVGQRDLLRQITALPRDKASHDCVAETLANTSEYVRSLRQQFNDLFEAASRPTGLLDDLETEDRAWAERRKEQYLWRKGFADSYLVTIPCWYESSWGSHALGIYSALLAICGIYIAAIAWRRPFRGAVDVGLGTEIDTEEVYGPVNVQVVELEKRAGYPRIVVGEGLVSHLNDLAARCLDSAEGKHTRKTVADSLALVATDHTGSTILDPLGEGVRSVPNAVPPKIVAFAYDFVLARQEEELGASCPKLLDYYTDLRTYFEARLHLWGIKVR
ncbi:MAG: hypothetical protein ACTSYX_08245 [Candidatus Thorarchaeota archaeon]